LRFSMKSELWMSIDKGNCSNFISLPTDYFITLTYFCYQWMFFISYFFYKCVIWSVIFRFVACVGRETDTRFGFCLFILGFLPIQHILSLWAILLSASLICGFLVCCICREIQIKKVSGVK
jgi:hypothetical protein